MTAAYQKSQVLNIAYTLPETNISPENGWLEYQFPLEMAYFQGRTVSFRKGTLPRKLDRQLFVSCGGF